MTSSLFKAIALAAVLPVAAFAASDTAYNLNVLPQNGTDLALANALQALISPPVNLIDAKKSNVVTLVDISTIAITTTYAGRAIFLNEFAGFKNSIGMLTNSGADFDKGDPDAVLLGFTGGKSPINISATETKRGAIVPITFTAGDTVQFFALTNSKRQGGTNSNGDASGTFGDVWYGNPSDNVDGKRHLVAFQPLNSPFLIFALDDQFAGPGGTTDLDFNDVLFAIDLGPNVPEPTTWMLVLGFLATGIFFWRREQLARC